MIRRGGLHLGLQSITLIWFLVLPTTCWYSCPLSPGHLVGPSPVQVSPATKHDVYGTKICTKQCGTILWRWSQGAFGAIWTPETYHNKIAKRFQSSRPKSDHFTLLTPQTIDYNLNSPTPYQMIVAPPHRGVIMARSSRRSRSTKLSRNNWNLGRNGTHTHRAAHNPPHVCTRPNHVFIFPLLQMNETGKRSGRHRDPALRSNLSWEKNGIKVGWVESRTFHKFFHFFTIFVHKNTHKFEAVLIQIIRP